MQHHWGGGMQEFVEAREGSALLRVGPSGPESNT